MMKETLDYLDYLKAAFFWKVRFKGLGYLPMNILFLIGFGILGLGNAGFWLIGLAFEIGYLLFLSGSPRFQKLVQGTMLEQNKHVWAEKQIQLLSTLDKASQDRYHNLARACMGIIQNTENNPGVEGLRSGELNQLIWIFLKLLNSRKKINQILSQTSQEQLEREIKNITDKLAKEIEGSPVYRSLQGTMEIQKRRLENFLKAEESFKVAESELDRIEKQVTLITEETTVSSDPEALSGRLEGVMQSLQGTTKWMTEHGEYFGSLDTEPTPADLLVAPNKSEKV
jgi:hypothetical protein